MGVVLLKFVSQAAYFAQNSSSQRKHRFVNIVSSLRMMQHLSIANLLTVAVQKQCNSCRCATSLRQVWRYLNGNCDTLLFEKDLIAPVAGIARTLRDRLRG